MNWPEVEERRGLVLTGGDGVEGWTGEEGSSVGTEVGQC